MVADVGGARHGDVTPTDSAPLRPFKQPTRPEDRVSRRCISSVSNGAARKGLILPVRERTCTEVAARTADRGLRARLGWQHPGTEGPSCDTFGGATIRPGWMRQPPVLGEALGEFQLPPRRGDTPSAVQIAWVVGGVTEGQWLMH